MSYPTPKKILNVRKIADRLKMPEKSAESWQLKKLELATRLVEQGNIFISNQNKIIEQNNIIIYELRQIGTTLKKFELPEDYKGGNI